MLGNKLLISNSGPTEVVFRAVIAGTALEFPLYLEDETSPGSGVYEPMDFTGLTFVSEVRLYAFQDVATATLGVTPRVSDPGWLDFFLPASVTLSIGYADVLWSCKAVPGSPNEEHAREIAAGMIPVRWGATR
jgi:hypothetical protein